MAGYNPPDPQETAAQEPGKNHKNHPSRKHTHHDHHAQGNHHSRRNRTRDSGAATVRQLINALGRSTLEDDESKHENGEKRHRNHTHPHAHGHHNKKKRSRGSGAATLKQLTRALAQSTLGDDDDSKPEDGKKLTKTQRKKQKTRPPRRGAHAQRPDLVGAAQSGSQGEQSTPRETRSRHEMSPLPFDNVYLRKVRGFRLFMDNDQTMDWVKSVFKPHIEDWWHDCLSAPENKSLVKAAQAAPRIFAEAVVEEAMDQHDSSGLLESLLGEADACPTAFHLEKKRNNSLTFIQHSAMVACLVVRDGQLSHQFSAKALDRKRHQTAAALLACVIKDLKADMGYFLGLFLDVKEEYKQKTSGRQEQGAKSQSSSKEISTVYHMDPKLFGSIGRALLDLRHNSACDISFLKADPSIEDDVAVVLAGTADQVNEADQEVRRILRDAAQVDRLSIHAGERGT